MELTEEIKKQYQNYNQDELNNAFWKECQNGHLEIVKYLLISPDLKEYADIHTNNDVGFRWACRNGYLEIVQYLLTSPDLQEHADIHADNDLGFQWACREGHLEIVKYLLTSSELKEHANIHDYEDVGFHWACLNNHLNIVTYLLSFNGEQCIDFQKSEYNLDWAIENQLDNIIIAMMKNLKKNNPFEYIECLPKIEAYNQELYEHLKNIEVEGLEVNPQETLLFV